MIARVLAELDSVKDIVTEREQMHGCPKENLERISVYWSNYLGINIKPEDVCLMMMLMKMGRLNTGKVKADSIRDLVGYNAIATALVSDD